MNLLLVLAVVYKYCLSHGARSADLDRREPLYILTTAPHANPLDHNWQGGQALLAATRLAKRQINAHTGILPGFRLETIEDDSGCRVTSTGTISFFRNALYNDKTIVGMVGPACSGPTLALASVLARKEISLIQIAPSATSPLIATATHDTTFTMVTSSRHIISCFVALMIQNHWNKVAILYDIDRDTFSAMNFVLLSQIQEHKGLEVVYTSHVLDGSENSKVSFFPLNGIASNRARVIFLLTSGGKAVKVLCLAHHMGLTYPKYQWVLSVETRILEQEMNLGMFEYRGKVYNCSKSIFNQALNATVQISYKLNINENAVLSATNQTYNHYRQLYSDELSQLQSDDLMLTSSDHWENAFYDAMWSFAFALNGALGNGLNLSNYQLGQPKQTAILGRELMNVSFEGATGHVKFSSSRNVESAIQISQLYLLNNSESVEEKLVAFYDQEGLYFVSNDTNFVPGTFTHVPDYIHLAVGVAVITITVILAFLTAVLQFLFIAWSNKRSIKATSPDIHHLVFSGCYLYALATILHSMEQTFNVGLTSTVYMLLYSISCNVIMWCLLIGYTLIFGTVFIKIWRVYRIFKHFRNKRPSCLTDKVLISTVVLLVGLDMLICILWSAINPWIITQTESYQIDDQIFMTVSCNCSNIYLWVGTVSAYKGLLAILIVVFATLNRKIRRVHFQHTNKLNILIYTLAIMYGIGFPLYFLLMTVNVYVTYLVLCAILLSTIVMCCLVLFVSPVVNVIKRHEGSIISTIQSFF